jgi:hypothetical protein
VEEVAHHQLILIQDLQMLVPVVLEVAEVLLGQSGLEVQMLLIEQVVLEIPHQHHHHKEITGVMVELIHLICLVVVVEEEPVLVVQLVQVDLDQEDLVEMVLPLLFLEHQ